MSERKDSVKKKLEKKLQKAGISDPTIQILLKGLEASEKERYQTINELYKDLQTAFEAKKTIHNLHQEERKDRGKKKNSKAHDRLWGDHRNRRTWKSGNGSACVYVCSCNYLSVCPRVRTNTHGCPYIYSCTCTYAHPYIYACPYTHTSSNISSGADSCASCRNFCGSDREQYGREDPLLRRSDSVYPG